MRLDVVELRAAVIAVARRYFTLPATDTISLRTADAMDFVRPPAETRYDLIFRSLFGVCHGSAARQPDLPGNRCAAERRGWLVLNYHDLPDENSLLYHSLHRVFSTVLFCVAPSGNVIIYATLARVTLPLSALRTAAAANCSTASSAICRAK